MLHLIESMAYGMRPVPQNIMSVEFKIFDFMTVKQFMFGFGLLLVAAGLAFILSGPWKIIVPLVIVLAGGVIIFVPFNGDPFITFVSSYLEAMVSPQRRVWYRKGLLIKSAFVAAKKYQYGDELREEDLNDFTLRKIQQETEQRMSMEQTALDAEEKKFLVTKNETSQTASSSPNPNTADVQKKVNELNELVPPSHKAKISPEDEETQVRNFIFGNIEAADGKSIAHAAIILKKEDKTLEMIMSSEGGDFITKSEYPEGSYLLHVNVGAQEFNEITINFDPIDPLPVVIRPKGAQQAPKVVVEEAKVNEQGIFEGAYNPSMFNIGFDYEGTHKTEEQESKPPQTQAISLQTMKSAPVSPAPVQIQEDAAAQTQPRQLVQTPAQMSLKDMGAQEIQPNEGGFRYIKKEEPDTNMNDSILFANSLVDQTAGDDYDPVYDFGTLPNSTSAFDAQFIRIPNTINGEIISETNVPLTGVLINVSDESGSTIRTIASGADGKFYTYTSLPNGMFTLNLHKDGMKFMQYTIVCNGEVYPPKVIKNEMSK